MPEPLRPDAAARHEMAVAALEALERLREARRSGGQFRPADAELLVEGSDAPPPEGRALHEVLSRFVDLAALGWDKSSPGDFSYVPNGALDAGVIGALLAAGSHAFTGAAFEAPGLVAMEEGVLAWMARLLGMPEGSGGLLLSGGSAANQAAIVTARACSGEEDAGLLYVSDRVHHSVVKAARLAGVPSAAMRVVASHAGRLDVPALRRQLRDDEGARLRPFLIVGVAGSTDTGSIDPLDELASVAADAGAWFHVDAAYGGFFALTERGRDRLRGVGRADSVTVDAHKGLFLPYGLGALLVRDPAMLVRAHEGLGAYLRDVPAAGDLPHYFQRGPELTRPARGVQLWFPLQLHGTEAFGRALDRMLDLAAWTHARLADMPGVVVGTPPETSIVTFRAEAGDARTQAIVDALHASNRFQVSTTVLEGRSTLRFAFLDPGTTEERVSEALHIVRAIVEPG